MALEPTARFRGGTGTPLLLLHAGWTCWQIWMPVLERLAQERDVLAPTMLGHLGGPPITTDRPPSFENLVAHVESEMDAAGFGEVDIVGNSIGCLVAFELARRGRARSVIALCPEGKQTNWHGLTLAARGLLTHEVARRFRKLGMRALRFPFLRKLLLRDASARGQRVPLELAEHLLEAVGFCDVLETFRANWRTASEGRIADVSAIACPVYFIWGENDTFVLAEEMRRYRADLPDARYLAIPDCGHCPQLDHPELVAGEILAFTGGAKSARQQVPAASR